MIIHESYYNEENRRIYIEFSTEVDSDNFYRILELTYDDILYFSPEIIDENDLYELDDNFLEDLIIEYLKENDLPDELVL